MVSGQHMREGEKLPTVERLVTQERIGKYAAASGDFNPIHIDRDFAEKTQFGSTIAHGMMVAATVSESMALAFKGDWLESGRLKLRFKAPVLPGDTVSTFGQVKSVRPGDHTSEVVCSVGVRKQTGDIVISGEATVVIPLSR